MKTETKNQFPLHTLQLIALFVFNHIIMMGKETNDLGNNKDRRKRIRIAALSMVSSFSFTFPI